MASNPLENAINNLIDAVKGNTSQMTTTQTFVRGPSDADRADAAAASHRRRPIAGAVEAAKQALMPPSPPSKPTADAADTYQGPPVRTRVDELGEKLKNSQSKIKRHFDVFDRVEQGELARREPTGPSGARKALDFAKGFPGLMGDSLSYTARAAASKVPGGNKALDLFGSASKEVIHAFVDTIKDITKPLRSFGKNVDDASKKTASSPFGSSRELARRPDPRKEAEEALARHGEATKAVRAAQERARDKSDEFKRQNDRIGAISRDYRGAEKEKEGELRRAATFGEKEAKGLERYRKFSDRVDQRQARLDEARDKAKEAHGQQILALKLKADEHESLARLYQDTADRNAKAGSHNPETIKRRDEHKQAYEDTLKQLEEREKEPERTPAQLAFERQQEAIKKDRARLELIRQANEATKAQKEESLKAAQAASVRQKSIFSSFRAAQPDLARATVEKREADRQVDAAREKAEETKDAASEARDRARAAAAQGRQRQMGQGNQGGGPGIINQVARGLGASMAAQVASSFGAGRVGQMIAAHVGYNVTAKMGAGGPRGGAGVGGTALVGAFVVTELVLALKNAVPNLKKFAESVHDSNAHLSQFSYRMSLANMHLNIGDFRRDMRMASETEDSASKLAETINSMRNSWFRFDSTMANVNNRLGTFAAQIAAGFGGPAGRLAEVGLGAMVGAGVGAGAKAGMQDPLVEGISGGLNNIIDRISYYGTILSNMYATVVNWTNGFKQGDKGFRPIAPEVAPEQAAAARAVAAAKAVEKDNKEEKAEQNRNRDAALKLQNNLLGPANARGPIRNPMPARRMPLP